MLLSDMKKGVKLQIHEIVVEVFSNGTCNATLLKRTII